MPANYCKPLPEFTEADKVRFWSKVDRSGGPEACHLWLGQTRKGVWKKRNGGTGIRLPYGKFSYGAHGFALAHRVAFYLSTGVDPLGYKVCHNCPTGDNPKCCNPLHLWLGSDADNVADRHAKGRDAKGDQNGARTHPEKWKRGAESTWSRFPELRERAQTVLKEHPELRSRGDNHYTRLDPTRVARGERQHLAKLTAEQVLEIRRRYSNDGVTYDTLGAIYRVTKHAIYSIVKRKTWKHI